MAGISSRIQNPKHREMWDYVNKHLSGESSVSVIRTALCNAGYSSKDVSEFLVKNGLFSSSDKEKGEDVSKVFTPFGVMVGDAGAYKSFDNESFYEEVLKPSEKAMYDKYKKDFLKKPKSDSNKVSAGFIPWKKLIIQSKSRNYLMLNKIMSNTWALNKEAIPGFIDLIEKLRGKYSTVLGDDKLLEYLEAAQHRARELEASGEVSGSSSKSETNSSFNALKSACNLKIFSDSRPVSQSVNYNSNGIPINSNIFDTEPCLYVGNSPVWIREGAYSDQRGRHEGYLVEYESPIGDWCGKLSFPLDASLSEIEEEVSGCIQRDFDSVEESSLTFSGKRDPADLWRPPKHWKDKRFNGTYEDEDEDDDDGYGDNLNPYGRGFEYYNGKPITTSSGRVFSDAQVDQQAYNNYVQQLVNMGFPEDQARQQADQMVAQIKQNTAQFVQNIQQPNQQGVGVAASFKRDFNSMYVSMDELDEQTQEKVRKEVELMLNHGTYDRDEMVTVLMRKFHLYTDEARELVDYSNEDKHYPIGGLPRRASSFKRHLNSVFRPFPDPEMKKWNQEATIRKTAKGYKGLPTTDEDRALNAKIEQEEDEDFEQRFIKPFIKPKKANSGNKRIRSSLRYNVSDIYKALGNDRGEIEHFYRELEQSGLSEKSGVITGDEARARVFFGSWGVPLLKDTPFMGAYEDEDGALYMPDEDEDYYDEEEDELDEYNARKGSGVGKALREQDEETFRKMPGLRGLERDKDGRFLDPDNPGRTLDDWDDDEIN